MQSAPKLAAGLVALALICLSAPAEAGLRVNLAGNYWLTKSGLFDITLTVDTWIASRVSVGGRVGAALTTEPTNIAVPLDLVVRVHLANNRVYVEGLGGPWIFFEGDTFRGHAALGVGLNSGDFSFGLELGWLSPRAIVGAKVGIRF